VGDLSDLFHGLGASFGNFVQLNQRRSQSTKVVKVTKTTSTCFHLAP
jgi:hypothetical protein